MSSDQPPSRGLDPAASNVPPLAPRKPDGSLYRYEMLYAGYTQRTYADDHQTLVDALIEGYSRLSATDQWVARLAFMNRAAVVAQAHLNTHPALPSLPLAQRTILQGSRHEPIVVDTWDCPVPLILMATDYLPAGKIPKPRRTQGMPPNVIYVDPSDDGTFIESLHDIAVVTLNEAQPAHT